SHNSPGSAAFAWDAPRFLPVSLVQPAAAKLFLTPPCDPAPHFAALPRPRDSLAAKTGWDFGLTQPGALLRTDSALMRSCRTKVARLFRLHSSPCRNKSDSRKARESAVW